MGHYDKMLPATEKLIEHLIRNDVISEEGIYDGLEHEITGFIQDAIDDGVAHLIRKLLANELSPTNGSSQGKVQL